MAKSKRPQQQPKRIGQSQPGGVSRAAAPASKANSATNGDAPRATTNGKSATSAAKATPASASNLSGIRERTQGAPQRRPQQSRRYSQQPWWRRNLGALITVATIVVLIGVFVGFALYQNKQAAAGIGDPVPASVMKDLTTVPASVFTTVGTGTSKSQITATAANTPLLTANGKPELIYVGAEYCPYCAGERWGTVVALSRFGTFSGLTLMRSSSTDVYPNTPTLSFRNAT